MKRLIFVIFTSLLLFSSCNIITNVKNKGIPTRFKTLEFWNGAARIGGPYDDVKMKIKIVTSTKVIGADIYFYTYHIYNKDKSISEWIVDSEALALKYTLFEEDEESIEK